MSAFAQQMSVSVSDMPISLECSFLSEAKKSSLSFSDTQTSSEVLVSAFVEVEADNCADLFVTDGSKFDSVFPVQGKGKGKRGFV